MKGSAKYLLLVPFLLIAARPLPAEEVLPQAPAGYPKGPFVKKNLIEPKAGEVIVQLSQSAVKKLTSEFKKKNPTLKPSPAMLAKTLAQSLGLTVSSTITRNAYVVKGRRINQTKIAKAKARGLVSSVENNYRVFAMGASSGATELLYKLGFLWGMNAGGFFSPNSDVDIDAPEAWDITTGDPSLVVGIIDTGVYYTHPDLADNIWSNPLETADGLDNDGNGFVDDAMGWDFYNKDNDPMDDHFHGTHCAGIVAAGLNGRGAIGVAPSVKIMPIKILNSSGEGDMADLVRAIDYAITLRQKGVNIRVLNASLGGGDTSDTLREIIRRAGQAGILFVAASGNSTSNNDETPVYPAGYELPTLVSVAAVDSSGALASFSNYGPRTVHIAAPGSMIWSTIIFNFYLPFDGTSMAAPFVSGVAALVFSRHPEYTAAQARNKILNSAKPLSGLEGQIMVPGMVDAYQALM